MCIAVQAMSFYANKTPVLKDVTVRLKPGQITAVIGPQNSGKGALLKCLSGEFTPSNGQVEWEGVPLEQWSPKARAEKRSLLLPNPPQQTQPSAYDVLKMPWYREALPSRNHCPETLLNLCHEFDLVHLLKRRYNELQPEQQLCVRFIRALINIHPQQEGYKQFLLLSEPTSQLNFLHEIKLLNYLQELKRRGVCIAVVLHDLNLAARFADKLVLLNQGQLVASGDANAVLDANILSRTYHIPVTVEYHRRLQRLLVHAN